MDVRAVLPGPALRAVALAPERMPACPRGPVERPAALLDEAAVALPAVCLGAAWVVPPVMMLCTCRAHIANPQIVNDLLHELTVICSPRAAKWGVSGR